MTELPINTIAANVTNLFFLNMGFPVLKRNLF